MRLVLDSRTAPVAVAALMEQLDQGGFDRTNFVWVQPHTEIRSDVPASRQILPSELDAHALRLDQQIIEHAGTAMELIQMELEPALMQSGTGASPQLQDWIRQWRHDFKPDFLIGTTRTQINQALGYHYQSGLASRPVRRGSVALVPAAAGRTTLALAIILRDQPARDGRWVVIGEVRSGLEVAEQLSLQPRIHPKRHQSLQPLPILKIRTLPDHASRRSSP